MRTTLVFLLGIAGLVACGGNTSSGSDSGPADAANDSSTPPVDASPDAHAGKDAGSNDAGAEAGPPSTTIAAARKAMVTTPITVNAFVTALAGVPKDYPNWYIEDPAGGEYSGVNVYCDPLGSTVCSVAEPALHDLIQVKGTLTTFKGQVELIPTAMTVLKHDATFPPVMALSASDVAPTANSPYRGVFVALTIGSELLVDDVTPAALFDTECGTPPPADAGAEAGTGDAGLPMCSPVCEPPVYSGFRANDGAGNEVYIEAPFFHTDPLQSSPECLTQSGVVAVRVGSAFSKMQGVLDVDPYAKAQALSPVLTTDYGLNK
jgi:hypothetical protein